MTTFVDAAFTREQLSQGTPVVNVLSSDSYRGRHIPGTLNVPLEEPNFDQRIQAAVPDKGKPVVVHCSDTSCEASTKAARRLETLGYTKVFDFKAGLQGWQEAGQEFESAKTVAAQAERPPRPGRERASRREEARAPETR
jgi:rhodanese-related sulfurtransferase